MIKSFYTASMGLMGSQKAMDVTANNIANCSTNGYKAESASFSDLLYTNIHQGTGTGSNLQVGSGTKIGKTDTIYTPGSLQATGRSLDYALTGDGFFAVKIDGDTKYTRDGNFSLSKQSDGKMYLASSQGGLVLNSKGEPIVVDNENSKLDIGVYVFKNNDALVREGGNLFVATEAPGEAVVEGKTGLMQGYLEGSSVDIAQEMVDMITNERSFGLNAKMIQVSDEVLQTINSLR